MLTPWFYHAAVSAGSVWEKIRLKHAWAYYESRYSYERTQIFEPGRIAVCRGSIMHAFFACLASLGIPLREREIPRGDFEMPFRYCIVNRHIEGNTYEVFLLTTFGGAKTLNNLGPLARNFGVPLGQTQWINQTASIATIPPILGMDKSSFIFALPTVKEVEHSNLYTATRVPPGELERLRGIVKQNIHNLPDVQKHARKYLRAGLNLNEGISSSRLFDDFKPLPMQRKRVESLDDDEMVEFLAQTSSKLSFKSYPIKIPDSNNLSWPLRYLMKDLDESKLTERPRILLPRSSVPKPYYASCLPIGTKAFQRLIR